MNCWGVRPLSGFTSGVANTQTVREAALDGAALWGSGGNYKHSPRPLFHLLGQERDLVFISL